MSLTVTSGQRMPIISSVYSSPSTIAFGDNSHFCSVSAKVGAVGTGLSGPLGISAKYSSAQARRGLRRRWKLKRAAEKLLSGSRAAKCMVFRKGNCPIQVVRSAGCGRARFTGLQTCSSVWACPICAARIAEQRRGDLQAALQQAKRLGYSVFMATFTLPHGMGDDVKCLANSMVKAYSSMHEGRKAAELKAAVGRIGFIRSVEVTYGANGFHPHLHVLFITDGSLSAQGIERLYSHRWREACVRVGVGEPSLKHGVTVQDGSAAASYVAKWGLENEMTKSHLKTGKQGSLSPFDFLRLYAEGGPDAERYGRLFQIYAKAFKGRRQLYWSHGLRDLLALDAEMSDEQAVEIADQGEQFVIELSREQWKAVLFFEARAQLLLLAGRRPAFVPEFVVDLVERWLLRPAGANSS